MEFDILTGAGALDLIHRTSSTLRVQQVVQLSLAPAFLLAGIGAVMNVMTNRLIWVANRIERILDTLDAGKNEHLRAELPALEQRRIYAQRAVMFSTASALAISVVILLLFFSAFVKAALGTLVASMWVVCMSLLVVGLGSFLMETRTAARRNRERMRERRSNPTRA